MAVAKMEMINLVGHLDFLDEVCKRIIMSESVHMLNAINEISENNFPIMDVDDIDALADINYIRPYSSRKDLKDVEKKINAIIDIFDLNKKVKKEFLRERYDFRQDVIEVNELYNLLQERHSSFLELEEEHRELDELKSYLIHIKDVDVNLNELFNLKYIKFKIGKLNKYDMDKVKKNYENISGIVLKFFQTTDYSLVMIFYPTAVENEVLRILNSVNFDELKFKYKFSGTAMEWIEWIEIRKIEIREEIQKLRDEILHIKKEYGSRAEKYYSKFVMETKIEELKNNIAVTNEFFYISGWIPSIHKKRLNKMLEDIDERVIVIYKDMGDVREGLEPPTYLSNGYLIRPFESIVKMYGIPSYKELDPTAFVGISYMLLFGAMFGDLGQGLVLFLIGEILNRIKHRPNLGGVLSRLGISSMAFGLIYGSFFGFEDILPTYIVRPMVEINKVLILAVAFGVILLSVGFFYNLVNCYRNNDLEEGIFSRNGVAGLVFYWMLLYYIIIKVEGREGFLPDGAILFILAFALILILFKEPIVNILKGEKRLYHESVSDYYIEGGFGIAETLLSLLSNTLSFIRVGAFAINHVGLFLAFETLAKMMHGGVGGALMLVLGNIVIIGLEGLIVFIQGLRLEYYELFSKFFKATGYEYSPICIRG
ncbi:V-type ATP synthase subunit I [Caloramator mitchellensis]|uniref:V-type ATP synthase subunit I n=1 Tax=Caloramator mitchellensis TaxID=908809 RepID=A0A0R3JXI2_CALMK|nr:V-type ATPase 116kDa subunit family protein [Caloramator mitchellensis]KRQ85902.1 V-type ATP synthase subunit I [Caloramator mitchellensis]